MGPKGRPLVGVLPQVRKDSLAFFVGAARDFGDVALLDFGLKQFLLVTHPDGLKHVLHDNAKNYVKGYDVVKPLLGDGLVTAEGECWHQQRRLIQPAFHRDRIHAFARTMTEETAGMLDRWAAAGRAGTPVDLFEAAMRLTQSIIVKTMFSRGGLGTGEEEERVHQAFAVTLDYFTYLMFRRPRLPDWVPTPTHRRFHHAIHTLEEVVYRLIDERRRSPPEEQQADLLSMLVHARDEKTSSQMDDRQLRDEVMTIFLAGHETTAVTLAWAWYLLSLHPEVSRRVEAEVDQVLQGREPTAGDVPKLAYTRMVVDETLRLYPAAWMFARTAVQEDQVNGYRVPAGQMLVLSPYVLHRRPDLWPNPEAFDPQRFAPENALHRHKYAYLPFSGGQRVCIGNNFALMEAILILAMAAQRYRLHLVPGRPVRARPTSTLRPQPGVWMTVHPRA
ncbi:MAG TPA: cytochrome P450 [Myxococcales bacterium]|nr:cytochrome P450 [Myxococcales bacterium]